MMTNLKLGGNAVVTDENGGIVCIIQCKSGKNDITEQLERAILNHECIESVSIKAPEVLCGTDSIEFTAILEDFEHIKSYKRNYNIELTATY